MHKYLVFFLFVFGLFRVREIRPNTAYCLRQYGRTDVSRQDVSRHVSTTCLCAGYACGIRPAFGLLPAAIRPNVIRLLGNMGGFAYRNVHGKSLLWLAVYNKIAVATLTLSDSTLGFWAIRTVWSHSVRVSRRIPWPSEPIIKTVAR